MTKEELDEATEALRNPREPLGHALALRIADLLEASTAAPEDVDRDVATVRGVFAGMEGEYAETMGALSRLATAAARVPGLEEWQADMLRILATGLDYTPTADTAVSALRGLVLDAEATEQRAVTAESERDAARQEVATAARIMQRVSMVAAGVAVGGEPESDAEHAVGTLAVRLVELEHGLLDLGRARMTAEARATAAEAKVKTLEERVRELHGNFIMSGPDAQPTPAPGLREAVGKAKQALGEYLRHGASDMADALGRVALDALAAYDGTAPGETEAKAAKWDAAVARAKDVIGIAREMRGAMGAMYSSAANSWEHMRPNAHAQWERGMSAVLGALGLTPPTPPGGGETKPEWQQHDSDCEPQEAGPWQCVPECKVPAPRTRIAPTPTPEVPALLCGRCGKPSDMGHGDTIPCGPAAPEVVWEGADVRVTSDGRLTFTGEAVGNGWGAAHALARALAEAKREAESQRRQKCESYREAAALEALAKSARKAAEDMRERAADLLMRVRGDGKWSENVSDVMVDLEAAIRALPVD